jgi:hypothetical protein
MRSYNSPISCYGYRAVPFNLQSSGPLKNMKFFTFNLPCKGTEIFPWMKLCLVVETDRTVGLERQR